MKLFSLERYLLKNPDMIEEDFKKLLVDISEPLELQLPEDRKLTDEEIDYEYIDMLITETLENLKDDVCTCEKDCGVPDCCGTRVEKNLKSNSIIYVKRWYSFSRLNSRRSNWLNEGS